LFDSLTLPDILVGIFFLPASAIGYFILYILDFHRKLDLERKEILFFSICFLCGASVTLFLALILYRFQDMLLIKDFLNLFSLEYLVAEMKVFPYLLPAQVLIFVSTPLWLLLVWSVMRRREKRLLKKLTSVDVSRAKESLHSINEELHEVYGRISVIRERIRGTKYLIEALPKSLTEGEIKAIEKRCLDGLYNVLAELSNDDVKDVMNKIKKHFNDLLTSLESIEKGDISEEGGRGN
jgi:hypothetical protein